MEISASNFGKPDKEHPAGRVARADKTCVAPISDRIRAFGRCISARSRRLRRRRAALLVPVPRGTVGFLCSVHICRCAADVDHQSASAGSSRSQLPLGARLASRQARFSRFTRSQFILPLTVLAFFCRGSGPGKAWSAVPGRYSAGEWSSSVFSVRVVVNGATDSGWGRDALALAPPAACLCITQPQPRCRGRSPRGLPGASRGDRLRRRLTTVTQTPWAARCAASSANR